MQESFPRSSSLTMSATMHSEDEDEEVGIILDSNKRMNHRLLKLTGTFPYKCNTTVDLLSDDNSFTHEPSWKTNEFKMNKTFKMKVEESSHTKIRYKTKKQTKTDYSSDSELYSNTREKTQGKHKHGEIKAIHKKLPEDVEVISGIPSLDKMNISDVGIGKQLQDLAITTEWVVQNKSQHILL